MKQIDIDKFIEEIEKINKECEELRRGAFELWS